VGWLEHAQAFRQFENIALPLSVQVFPIAKELADCVIPAEYGISAPEKLRIAKKIAAELIGKLLVDLDTSRHASEAAAYDATGAEAVVATATAGDGTRLFGTGEDVLEHEAMGEGDGEV
jgi:hypothetical protein